MIGVNAQTIIFLQSLLLGAALGLFYDMFRILRLTVPAPSAVVFAEDLLYFAFCAFVTFLFMMNTIYGSVRVFVLLGELLGASVYYFTVGATVMKAAEALLRAVKWVLRLLYRLLIAPVARLFRWIWRGTCRRTAALSQRAGNFSRNIKICLKRQRALLYNLFNSRKREKSIARKRPGRGI